MKREKRPWMLVYLLVGVLVLSTGLNYYFLLQLDERVWDEEMQMDLQETGAESSAVTLRLPDAPPALPDTASASDP